MIFLSLDRGWRKTVLISPAHYDDDCDVYQKDINDIISQNRRVHGGGDTNRIYWNQSHMQTETTHNKYISQIIGIWRNNETDNFLVSCVSLSSIKYQAPNILLCIFTLLSALFDLYSTLLKRLNISSCYWSSVYKILSNCIK